MVQVDDNQKAVMVSVAQSGVVLNKTDVKPGFSLALTAWYRENYRRLPWRETSEPYRIWLSEIMLQQTQVATVIAYYERFLKRFPTLADLAKADEQDVLKLWEGLGYYARCRNLHKAAKTVMETHGGEFPDTLEAVEGLSGIGRSTAGAILTFAKGQRHPLLDGNVKRVLSRLFDVEGDVAQAATQKQMWAQSESLLNQAEWKPENASGWLPQDNDVHWNTPYVFNQALMELGATVCMPKKPVCLVCPVKSFCDSAAAGTQHERPVKATRKPTPHHNIGAAVIWHQTEPKILIQKRPAKGLLGGLWEFPGGKQELGESLEETVVREIQEELSIAVQVDESVAVVKHAYSHFKITLYAYHCRHVSGTPMPSCADDWCWVSPDNLTDYPFPKANNKVIEVVQAQWRADLLNSAAEGVFPKSDACLV